MYLSSNLIDMTTTVALPEKMSFHEDLQHNRKHVEWTFEGPDNIIK